MKINRSKVIAAVLCLIVLGCASASRNIKKGLYTSNKTITALQEEVAIAALDGFITSQQERELVPLLDKARYVHNKAVRAFKVYELYQTLESEKSLAEANAELVGLITEITIRLARFKKGH